MIPKCKKFIINVSNWNLSCPNFLGRFLQISNKYLFWTAGMLYYLSFNVLFLWSLKVIKISDLVSTVTTTHVQCASLRKLTHTHPSKTEYTFWPQKCIINRYHTITPHHHTILSKILITFVVHEKKFSVSTLNILILYCSA